MNFPSLRSLIQPFLWTVVSVLVGLMFINGQSFWMDEGNAISKAIMPNPVEMLNFAKHLRGSEIQMPLFMLCLWCWEKLVGHSEYLLRLINLPFLVVAVLALRRIPLWPVVCLTSPFVLYYAGELRPYMFQIAGAAVGFASLWRLAEDQEGKPAGLNGLLGACVFLAASSLTAAVWSLGLLAGLLVLRPGCLKTGAFWKRVLIWAPLALVVAGYHGYMLAEGYRGAVARGGGLLSMGFGFYELMGMMGLGPERDVIRSLSVGGLLGTNWWLPVYALFFAAAWIGGVKVWLSGRPVKVWVGMAVAAGLPLAILAAVSVLANFSVLGRHMSPLLPWLLVPIAFLLRESQIKRVWLIAVLPVLAGSVASAVILRTAERHERDDYRRATSMVVEDLKMGRTIQWNADMNAPRFYVFREGGMPMMHAIQILESEKPETLFAVDAIYINRPDLRYPGQDYRAWFADQGFRLDAEFRGFEVWRNKFAD
jgi:hypothetical protein